MDKLSLVQAILASDCKMDKLSLVQAILASDCKTQQSSKAESFLELGKVYAIRTVTMIYTGRLKAVNEQELLIDEAAWIPDTERWADFVDTGAHKEAEPYKRPVVIGRGGILDCTEIPSAIRTQK
jgi:hypothetical protein